MVERGVVGHGWDGFDFQAHENAQQIIDKIGSVIGRHANLIRMFKGIKEGDWILVPLPSAVVVGKDKGKEVRDEGAPSNAKNQQQVEFPRDAQGCILPKAEVAEKIVPVIEDPSLAGPTHWTATKLHGWIKEHLQAQLGDSTTVRDLQEQEYKLKVPRPWPLNQDEELRQTFCEKLRTWQQDLRTGLTSESGLNINA